MYDIGWLIDYIGLRETICLINLLESGPSLIVCKDRIAVESLVNSRFAPQ